MGLVYTVKQGDCLSSIAGAHGFADWRTIYDAPENEAFRLRRPNPNLVHPGDELHIPEKEPKEVSLPAMRAHRFRVKLPACAVRIQLRDDEGQALAGKKFELVLEGETFVGKTGDDGLVERRVSPRDRRAKLRFWLVEPQAADAPPDIEWDLDIGHLDPVEEVSGMQARLENLGFPCHGVDGKLGPRTAAALRAFQVCAGLEPTGIADDPTRAALRRAHDEGS